MTEPMTPEELAEIKEIDAARTPGRWIEAKYSWAILRKESSQPLFSVTTANERAANSLFVALASVAIPALVTEVERLTFELDATHKFSSGLREEIDTLHTAFEEHSQQIRDQQETINFLRKKLHELGVSA